MKDNRYEWTGDEIEFQFPEHNVAEGYGLKPYEAASAEVRKSGGFTMPKVKDGESRAAYMGRCVPVVMKEGLDQNAAVGKCEGMYNQARKSFTPIGRAVQKARSIVRKVSGMSTTPEDAADIPRSTKNDLKACDLQIAKAADLAKNLIHNPKDESGRIEGPVPDVKGGNTVAKDGYKNPPDEVDPQLQRGSITNPTASSVHNSLDPSEALRVHRDHAASVYETVYKQARLAGYENEQAHRDAQDAKDAIDREYTSNLKRQVAIEKARLRSIRGGS
jgi:hypothetical protein